MVAAHVSSQYTVQRGVDENKRALSEGEIRNLTGAAEPGIIHILGEEERTAERCTDWPARSHKTSELDEDPLFSSMKNTFEELGLSLKESRRKGLWKACSVLEEDDLDGHYPE